MVKEEKNIISRNNTQLDKWQGRTFFEREDLQKIISHSGEEIFSLTRSMKKDVDLCISGLVKDKNIWANTPPGRKRIYLA